MHSQVTKTVADKILKELGENETLGMHSTNKFERGSQFVFWTPQVRSFCVLLPNSFASLPSPPFPRITAAISTLLLKIES